MVIDFKPNKTYYPTVVEQADKGNDAVLPLLAKYKNPNDRGRMNRLLKANMKREGMASDAGCEAVTTWNDPSFEWYAKAACHAALSQQDAYVGGILPLAMGLSLRMEPSALPKDTLPNSRLLQPRGSHRVPLTTSQNTPHSPHLPSPV